MILLVRHALVDACGVFLAGRMPHVHLNEKGVDQAARLADHLSDISLAAVYTSPLERARETAGALARPGTAVTIHADLNEVDFGEWTGMAFDELNRREEWAAFNRRRSAMAIPGGEWMADVQSRACAALTAIHRAHPRQTVAIVSHADVLRVLVAAIIGTPIDRIDQFTIDPASVSVVEPTWRGFELTRLNCHAYRHHCCASND